MAHTSGRYFIVIGTFSMFITTVIVIRFTRFTWDEISGPWTFLLLEMDKFLYKNIWNIIDKSYITVWSAPLFGLHECYRVNFQPTGAESL